MSLSNSSKNVRRSEILNLLSKTDIFAQILNSIGPAAQVEISGLWGSAGALLLAAISRKINSTILVACSGSEEADRLEDDLASFCPREVLSFPAWDVLPGESEQPERECLNARLCVLEALNRSRSSNDSDPTEAPVIIAPASALMQPVPRPEKLFQGQLELRPGLQIERENLLKWLTDKGYQRAASVVDHGHFAIRGGILDVFPLFADSACRVEFDDDRVDNLRSFDPETQRSTGTVNAVRITGLNRDASLGQSSASLLDYLPPDGLLVVSEPEDLLAHARLYAAGFTGNLKKKPDPKKLMLLLEKIFPRLNLRSTSPESDWQLDFGATSLERLVQVEVPKAIEGLLELSGHRKSVFLFSENVAESQRLAELLETQELDIPPSLKLMVGRISGGFDWPQAKVSIVTERQLLGRYRRSRRLKSRPAPPSIPIESLTDLVPGDYVVHRTHGIGKYLCMESIEKKGRLEEHLMLLYADDVRLYVPAGNIDLVARYLAAGGGKPQLSRIGSKRWAEKTRRAEAAIHDIASEHLELAAVRARQPGIVCQAVDNWEQQFVDSFPYDDTPDQAAAWLRISSDLESPRPADHLLCGDVGFGKTEIAVRAAFKVVNSGFQAAILVPTTLLAEQHGRTFRERMAEYPMRIEVLSRFRKDSESRQILNDLAEGKVDIVIGTHRLLQKDVAIRDIGLVVIDEEQRFGVTHKEKLKQLRAAVNVLTLTATPIPRTLHMAMLGMREISSLQTPPADRQAVRTLVTRWNDDLIRRAIMRELARDGQIYFVHNRVRSIDRIAAKLAELIPEARIAVAHGQMNERELNKAMKGFLAGKTDILLSTVIIESGIDIPNVNTIFIDRADRFGLADLHQLRGRVGRYRNRAYCYLMIPPEEMVSREALSRVKALEEFSDLGAGFRLAMRDLELRGAGNILGDQQSGHIAAIGYDMYSRMLEKINRRKQGLEIEVDWECTINLTSRAIIPPEYLPDESERLEAYRRIATCRDDQAITGFVDDLIDRYGRLPEDVLRLTAESRIRNRARAAKISFIAIEDNRLVLKFFQRNASNAAKSFPKKLGPRFPDVNTMTLAIPENASKPDQPDREPQLFKWVESTLKLMAC
jgi:transcription-repair coupling factor (superfamily II helicase)